MLWLPRSRSAAPSSVNEDATYTLNLSATGNPANHPITSWSINWGDDSGTQTVSGNPDSVTHVFADASLNGPDTVTATAINDEGQFAASPLGVNVVVDVPTVTISGNSSVNEDDTYTLNLSATGNPSNHPITSWTINWGDGSDSQTVSGNPDSVTHVFADASLNEPYAITAFATDDEGNFAAPSAVNVSVLVVPPTVTISGPSSVNEDDTYTLTLSATSNPSNHPITGWTINWGDNSGTETISGNPSSVTHVYADASLSGPYPITATAIEDEGSFNSNALDVNVNVVAPTVTISGNSSVNEDDTYTLNLSATGNPSNHPITGWTINWGDNSGTETISGNPSSVTHVYADASLSGPYPITATAIEDEGSFNSNALDVNVNVVAPTVTISGNSSVNEDDTYTLNLSATGNPSNHPITGWTINWGDNSGTETISGNPSSVTHVYADASLSGPYPITATAIEDEGTFSANSLEVNVNVVPPTVTINGASSINEDDTYTLNLSATGNPSNHPITSWMINWGDNSGTQTVSGNPSSVTHVYADASLSGPYPITATAIEDEGTFISNTLDVNVAVVAPTVTISGDSSVNEGDTYTLTLSATGNPSNHPITGWTINWGDNSATQTVSGNPSSVTHIFPDASLSGPYPITATAIEDEGSFISNTLNVNVNVVAPTVTISGPSSINEDDTYSLNLSATGNPSNHPITGWTIDWGDGSGTQTISGNPSSVTHVFADASLNGPYPITAIAIEDEGQFSANSLNVTVNVVAPTVTISGASSVNEDATYTLNLSATGNPANHPITSWSINWGDDSGTQTVSGNPDSVTHVFADASLNGPDTVTATAINDEGQFAASPLGVNVVVDAPTVTISGNSSVNEDDTYTLNLSATGNPSNHPITSWTINWGDGSDSQTVSGNPDSVTHVFADASLNEPYAITAFATDDEGNFAAPSAVNVSVLVVPPTVTISGPSSVNEDDTYTLTLSATSNPSNHPITGWTINWGDNSGTETISGNPSSVTHVYADASLSGPYPITATAIEDEGSFISNTLNVNVNVVAPTVTISGPSSINEDDTYSLNLSATGNPSNHPITGWTIDWGDGSGTQTISGNPSSVTHVFADASLNGPYPITAIAIEDEGQFSANLLNVTVNVVAPTVTISGASSVNEDATYTLNLSATGNPANHPITSWSINWGDDSGTQTVSGNPDSVTHVFADASLNGPDTVTATAINDEGQFAASPLGVNVVVDAPTVTISGNSSVNEDDTYTLNLSATGNPSNHPITSWTINWGDGSDSQTVSGNPDSVTHVFADASLNEPYAITAFATDDEGNFAAPSAVNVSVLVVPPTVTISGPSSVNEDDTYTLTLSATSNPSNHPITGWTINWGDNSGTETISGNPSSVTHVYADASLSGPYPITATAIEDEGSFNSNALDVNVNVVAPTVTISGNSSVNKDDTYTLNLSATGNPSNHPITGWTINWGDNSGTETISGNPSSVTHVYADASLSGPYPITATAIEDEGTFNSNTLNVNVNVVDPTVTISGNSAVNEDATYTLNLSATGNPSNHPITGWTINWGDGTGTQTVSGNPSSVTHVYANAGPETITASAINNEQIFPASPLNVSVAIVPPTVTISGPSSVNEEVTYTLNLSATGNPSNHPITGWTINWGDNSGTQTVSGNPSSTTHVFATPGTYTITAQASTNEGIFPAASSVLVTVTIAAPIVTISGPASVNEEATYTLNLSATGNPANHPITSWTINWGDGSGNQPVSGDPTSVTHVYPNATLSGPDTITASATNDQGTLPAQALSVNVLVVPPTVTASGPASISEGVPAGFLLGDAASFGVLYEGNGNNQLSTTNVTINGNIGIGASLRHHDGQAGCFRPGNLEWQRGIRRLRRGHDQ